MLIQAGVLAVQLEPGRGYSFTSFGEAMLGGIAPFIADSFDTLEDTLFGGFCFLLEKSGLHVLGGISWAYLALFHVCLMFQDRFLAEMFSNHLSVFALATQDLKSKSAGLSHTEKAMALIGKQLARTKRQLLLVENIPQAGFAIMFLAVEGGSVVVALLNLAIPALQVLVSVCFYGRVQKRLAGWYAQRLDAAVDDGDAVLGRAFEVNSGKAAKSCRRRWRPSASTSVPLSGPAHGRGPSSATWSWLASWTRRTSVSAESAWRQDADRMESFFWSEALEADLLF